MKSKRESRVNLIRQLDKSYDFDGIEAGKLSFSSASSRPATASTRCHPPSGISSRL